MGPRYALRAAGGYDAEVCSFLCLITPLCSYLYGGLYGRLYERADIIRYFPFSRRRVGPTGRRRRARPAADPPRVRRAAEVPHDAPPRPLHPLSPGQVVTTFIIIAT